MLVTGLTFLSQRASASEGCQHVSILKNFADHILDGANLLARGSGAAMGMADSPIDAGLQPFLDSHGYCVIDISAAQTNAASGGGIEPGRE